MALFFAYMRIQFMRNLDIGLNVSYFNVLKSPNEKFHCIIKLELYKKFNLAPIVLVLARCALMRAPCAPQMALPRAPGSSISRRGIKAGEFPGCSGALVALGLFPKVSPLALAPVLLPEIAPLDR